MFEELRKRSIKISNEKKYCTKRNHVAFIMKRNAIYAIGWNKTKTHPRMRLSGYNFLSTQLHAELDAIIKFGKDDCRKYDLVVVRINKEGQLKYSRPCAGCSEMIKQVGFRAVWYSTPEGFIKTED